MRTVRIKVYKYAELGGKAQKVALNNMREGMEFHWGDEYIDSIKKGCEHFDFELKHWSIDWDSSARSSFTLSSSHSEEVDELSGARLWKFIQNNSYLKYRNKYHNNRLDNLLDGDCPFTGYCGDENFLDAVREFIAKPTNMTFKELIEECVERTIKAGCADWDYQNSEKGIVEEMEANDYEFYENGKRFYNTKK